LAHLDQLVKLEVPEQLDQLEPLVQQALVGQLAELEELDLRVTGEIKETLVHQGQLVHLAQVARVDLLVQ
jgi:hypothetical protein